MNELAMIFDRLGIRTRLLAAAGTKWNFLRFTPAWSVALHRRRPVLPDDAAEELGYLPRSSSPAGASTTPSPRSSRRRP